jgi:hypothetical protein
VKHLEILTGSRSWSCTPSNYSSMIYLQFAADNSGLAVYGYGQTICANVKFRFGLEDDKWLRLEYLSSPQFQRFSGFEPTPQDAFKRIGYSLTAAEEVLRESVTGTSFKFTWRLDLDLSPFPASIQLPHAFPNTFYGYRESLGKLPTTP